MSKYEHLIGKFQPEPQNKEYQVRVDMRKKELLSSVSLAGLRDCKILLASESPSDLAKTYADLKERKEELEDLLENVNLALAAMVQMIDAKFNDEDIANIRVAGVGLLGHRREPSVKEKNREAFRAWCINNKLAASLVMNPKTREGLVRHRLLEGLAEPDGLEIYWRPKVTLTRE